jgi:hypothetical protein
MSLFNRKPREPVAPPPPKRPASAEEPFGEDGSVWVTADDDLMTRAEKIVWSLGYRGATGGFAINVYRVLELYAKYDTETLSGPQETE